MTEMEFSVYMKSLRMKHVLCCLAVDQLLRD